MEPNDPGRPPTGPEELAMMVCQMFMGIATAYYGIGALFDTWAIVVRWLLGR